MYKVCLWLLCTYGVGHMMKSHSYLSLFLLTQRHLCFHASLIQLQNESSKGMFYDIERATD